MTERVYEFGPEEPWLDGALDDDGDIVTISRLSDQVVEALVANSRASSVAECNADCRDFAARIVNELRRYPTESEKNFCHSIIACTDARRLSPKQVRKLYQMARDIAGRAIAGERRAHRYLVDAVPANSYSLPI
jgi:hypothetical protein